MIETKILLEKVLRSLIDSKKLKRWQTQLVSILLFDSHVGNMKKN